MKTALVIGAGLMGIQVCARLAEKGWNVICVNQVLPYAASYHCSGWLIPFLFRFPVWKEHAHEILQHSTWFYDSLYPTLQHNLSPIQLWRPCTIEEQNSWMAFAADIPFPAFQVSAQNKSPFTDKIENGLWFHCFILDTHRFLTEAQKKLQQQYSVQFIPHTLAYSDIQDNTAWIQGTKISFDYLFFCEGYLGKDNPFFPEAQNKIQVQYGEWIQMDWPYPNMGFYHDHYGLPYQGKIIIGSRHETDENQMFAQINPYLSTLYQITEQKEQTYTIHEGKRPGLVQGNIPIALKKDNYFWLNGLGSRGILYAAWFSHQFYSHYF